MNVGLILNTQFVTGEDPVVKVGELVEQVRMARDHGFDSICVSHHDLRERRRVSGGLEMVSAALEI